MNKQEFWEKIVGRDWYEFARGVWDSDYMDSVMSYVNTRYQQATVFPQKRDIFRAFKLCKPGDIKVVLLGQDPYPDGSATGLAFANTCDTLNISPSLQKIWESIEKSTDKLRMDFDITLEEWAKQGVLLLNTSLTVEKFKIGSHVDVWRKFTNAILLHIALKNQGVHFVFWGKKAQAFIPTIDTLDVHIHKHEHPAYAYRQNKDWNCSHFTDINSILKEHGQSPINW